MGEDTPIGTLRWPVTIAQRVQTVDGGTSLTETQTNVLTVHADIQPVGAMTFLAGVQTDRPITHRVRMRWLDWIDETYVITRQSTRLDGSTRTEVFRIRRVKEIAGRKRFIELEVEQESRA